MILIVHIPIRGHVHQAFIQIEHMGGLAGAGVMFELGSISETASLLRLGGWSLLTGINVILFSLVHNPCTTTLYTIYRETGSVRWTTRAGILPLAMGLVLCLVVAQFWRLLV